MRGRRLWVGVLGGLLAAVLGGGTCLAGGGGGAFVDVDSSHPAYPAIRALVDRGVVQIGASGEFQGSQPLLRYDAAQWLYRSLQSVQAETPGELDELPGRVSTVENRLTTVSNKTSSLESEVQSLKSTVATLQRDVGNLRDVAPPGEDVVRRVQTNFVLGVTAVVLGVAALAAALFF